MKINKSVLRRSIKARIKNYIIYAVIFLIMFTEAVYDDARMS